jgi:hypothetical protein
MLGLEIKPVLKHLLSMHKALGLISSTEKKKKKNERQNATTALFCTTLEKKMKRK